MSNKPILFLKTEASDNMSILIKKANKAGFKAVITSLINPECYRDYQNEFGYKYQINSTRTPLILNVNDWIHNVVPYIKPRNLSVNENAYEDKKSNFVQDICFSNYVKSNERGTTPNMMIKLSNQDPESLAESLMSQRFMEFYGGKILLELPMTDEKRCNATYCSDIENEDEKWPDQWNVWNKFYSATNKDPNLELALEIPCDLPSEEEIRRWLGEPIGMIIVPSICFTTNQSNYPVLPKSHQEVIIKLLQYTNCAIAIEPISLADFQLKMYTDYINYIVSQKIIISEHTGLEDQLRYPLQPLYDNLDTHTYETFEKDPIKYKLYQQAIEEAIVDKISGSEVDKKYLIVIVLGAGRGPLVRAVVNAGKNKQRKLKILVVEKNPNAICILRPMLEKMWPNEDIKLLSQDMRTVELDEKADIIVSELLGSFGDNELSPECLDGAQKLLKPDGISIPKDSTSYIRPVMSARLTSSVREMNNRKRNPYKEASEVTWLTMHSSVYYIDEPKEAFKFIHPNKCELIDNSRYISASFEANLDCIVDGFSGYFTSSLYNSIEISILPETHTQGMASWYPMFFPFSSPLSVKKGGEFLIELWRKVDNVKVWYEWRIENGKIHNENGENHPIFL